jgi:hypothetical protein
MTTCWGSEGKADIKAAGLDKRQKNAPVEV